MLAFVRTISDTCSTRKPCRCLHLPVTLPCICLSRSLAFACHIPLHLPAFACHIPLHLPVTVPPNPTIHDALSHCLSFTRIQQQPWVSTAEDDDEGIQQQLRKLEALEASHAQMSLVQSRLLSLALGTSLAPSCTHTRVSLSCLLSPLSCVLFLPPLSSFLARLFYLITSSLLVFYLSTSAPPRRMLLWCQKSLLLSFLFSSA